MMMTGRRLELSYQTPTFTLTRHPDGVLVYDKLAKRSYVVRVISGRFVGPCSCGSTATDPWNSCRHQNAVRTYLMDYYFGGRRYNRAG